MRYISTIMLFFLLIQGGCAHITRGGVKRASLRVISLEDASFTYEKNFHWPYKPERVRLFRWMYNQPQERLFAGYCNVGTLLEYTTLPATSPTETEQVPTPAHTALPESNKENLVPPPPKPADIKLKANPQIPQPPDDSLKNSPPPRMKLDGPVANESDGLQLSGFITPWGGEQQKTSIETSVSEGPQRQRYTRPNQAWLFAR